MQPLDRRLRSFHEDAFGDLEHEMLGSKPRFPQSVRDIVDKSLEHHQLEREIHACGQMSAARQLQLPRPYLSTCLSQDPFPQRRVASTASPTLAETNVSSPPISKAGFNASRTRPATSSASSRPISSSSRIANSSPPNRATVSPGRTDARRRSPTCTNNASPAPCPRVSLIDLKSSTSSRSIARGVAARASRSSACPSRSLNSVR